MPAQVAEVRELLAMGVSVVQIARRLETSRQTIMRLRTRDSDSMTTESTMS
jgi:DNA-binding NarL/FixJ family response regulator